MVSEINSTEQSDLTSQFFKVTRIKVMTRDQLENETNS
jgi:hypothetical protein